jgi:hypothetical protein
MDAVQLVFKNTSRTRFSFLPAEDVRRGVTSAPGHSRYLSGMPITSALNPTSDVIGHRSFWPPSRRRVARGHLPLPQGYQVRPLVRTRAHLRQSLHRMCRRHAWARRLKRP